VSAGATHACAVLPSGEVRCWGNNSTGQLGTGDVLRRKGAASDPPLRPVELGSPAVSVAAGGAHTCALLRDASVKCWGSNGAGQLGLGDTEDRGDEPGELGEALAAVDFGPNQAALAVSAGNRHSCALLDDGSVRCWGANESGQLGLGDTEHRGDDPGELGTELPRVLLGPATAVAVDAGDEHTCVLLADGQVSCFGANLLGELGTGDMVNHGSRPLGADTALPRVPLPANDRAVAISAGANHSCAVLRDGGLVCWGFNRAGQLGVGDPISRGQRPEGRAAKLERVDLGAERTALAVSAGASHTCALLSERSVACWGINLFGTLGSGDTVSPRGVIPSDLGEGLHPTDLGTDAGGRWRAGALSAGLDFTCAALDGGAVKCWGFNGSGQLGLGDVEPRGDDAAELGDALPAVSLDRTVDE
jgi:alpha-tubulin suppressor-like RCC1 family protein